MKFQAMMSYGNTLSDYTGQNDSRPALGNAKKRYKQAKKYIKKLKKLNGEIDTSQDNATLPKLDQAEIDSIGKMNTNELLRFSTRLGAFAQAYITGYVKSTQKAVRDYQQCVADISGNKTVIQQNTTSSLSVPFFQKLFNFIMPSATADGPGNVLYAAPPVPLANVPLILNQGPIYEPRLHFTRINITPIINSINYLRRIRDTGPQRISDLRNARYDTLKTIYAQYYPRRKYGSECS